MSEIIIENLTKDYGNGKGIFDVSFEVNRGEVFGFLGPNGAGKTTTIRQLMGFTFPEHGACYIQGMDCCKEQEEIQKILGYLPGELALMDELTGVDFIKLIAGMRGMTDFTYSNYLIEFLEFDPTGRIKKMSKGMKQKLGLVCAFMHDPQVLILDEPTSGLDPLMQSRFVELILMEKKKGKTILMSSHMFDEVEKTCDRVGIIRKGKLVVVDTIEHLKEHKVKLFIVTVKQGTDLTSLVSKLQGATAVDSNKIQIAIKGSMDSFIKTISGYEVISLEEVQQNLEQIFMQFYGGESHAK